MATVFKADPRAKGSGLHHLEMYCYASILARLRERERERERERVGLLDILV
ncbi:hypothetical protein RHGRI_035733 [Rhododendron griersonianum]|uniref:Uncharacterized protein n=1 Tax=Rhododendron griersonianum TaxID=479676 RepID=A0AAV6HPA5_9ERIC|nr:hypothetical protein RHGRI_035733 [Rhododendron griersonianum]